MSAIDLAPVLATTRPDASPAGERRLSALEWSVVALARRDRLDSLREPGRLARAVATLFGGSGRARLADPRLEALRRLAVHAWHRGYQLPVSELKEFLRSGFSAEQLDAVLRSVAAARTAGRRPLAG